MAVHVLIVEKRHLVLKRKNLSKSVLLARLQLIATVSVRRCARFPADSILPDICEQAAWKAGHSKACHGLAKKSKSPDA